MTEDKAIADLIEAVKDRGVETEGYQYPDCDAKTYWEIRCGLVSNTLDKLFQAVYDMAPAGEKEKLDKIWQDYSMMYNAMPKVLTYDGEVREEYKDEPPLDAA